LNILGGLYGRAAAWRRDWYDRHPERRRQLRAPVISIGNVVVGGSGKTPTVAEVVRVLQQLGERPAILSRGYGRREASAGVVVVSDGARVLQPAARSGDEPQMLARALPGVPVLVARSRWEAGVAAERQFGVTVHVLDDGFQHLQLARDVDLVIVSRDDLTESALPHGRLREPLVSARRADAVLVPGTEADRRAVAAQLRCGTIFGLEVHHDALEMVGRRVVAVAGIARPERFFAAVRRQGVEVAREFRFRDHHWFTRRDVEMVERAAADLHADAVVTTEKDAVRLDGTTWIALPMRVVIEPRTAVAEWLAARLRAARARRGTAA
jgi:tetraacyldisaccharide 4'-kinase